MADIASRIGEMIRARGPEYERRVRDRLERERERKREARKHQTPEQRECERERERRRSRRKLGPFMAIDGEGGGTDHLGRQNYLLMVASGKTAGEERVLHREGMPLSVRDCLEFILSLPPRAKAILVGYGIGYDATQILRGITKQETLRQILNPRQGKNGPCYTYWGDYAIIYQQGQYFRVARVDRSGPKPAVIKGSSRTVHETLGLFQCTFAKAIANWGVGSEQERVVIAEMKGLRDGSSKLTKEIIDYCKLECRDLATLMTEFRDVCTAAGIVPKQWSGAGWLASALLEKYGVPKRPLTSREMAAAAEQKPAKNPKPMVLRRPERDRQFEVAANLAFYGGRFETSCIGYLRGPVTRCASSTDVVSRSPAANHGWQENGKM
jgi:hypothetical protein